MITIRKLSSMEPSLQLRKAVRICRALELEESGHPGSLMKLRKVYIKDLFALLRENPLAGERLEEFLASSEIEDQSLTYLLADLRYLLMETAGISAGDWNFYGNSGEGSLQRPTMPMQLYLDRIRSPFNVGSIFRTAESFGVSTILAHPFGASPDHPRAQRSAMGCIDHIPWRLCSEQELSGPVFALETGGEDISTFAFPLRATVVIGSEELGVSPQLLKRSDESLGRVTIPTAGLKGSLNVSVACGILLFHWWKAISSRPVTQQAY